MDEKTVIGENTAVSNFIHDFIDEDLKNGVYDKVQTRFPPEPNGYLHIGHAKAICIDFGTAEKYGGICNLRLDDTNPTKEDVEYVDSIKEDVKWLGFDWKDRFYYASDYFDIMFENACKLIEKVSSSSFFANSYKQRVFATSCIPQVCLGLFNIVCKTRCFIPFLFASCTAR